MFREKRLKAWCDLSFFFFFLWYRHTLTVRDVCLVFVFQGVCGGPGGRLAALDALSHYSASSGQWCSAADLALGNKMDTETDDDDDDGLCIILYFIWISIIIIKKIIF